MKAAALCVEASLTLTLRVHIIVDAAQEIDKSRPKRITTVDNAMTAG